MSCTAMQRLTSTSGSTVMQSLPCCSSRSGVSRTRQYSRPFRRHVMTAALPQEDAQPSTSGRRIALAGLLATSLFASTPQNALAVRDVAKEVGSYLPPADVGKGFVEFVPGSTKTPSLRAGTVDPNNPYRFALPPTVTELKISNTQSGNYCQPRCDEPWTEVAFADDGLGKVELIVTPLVKFTSKKSVKIQDLGPPEFLINRIGNYITGSYLDEDDILSAEQKPVDSSDYYYYELNAGYAKDGLAHSITAVAVKGDLCYFFIAKANDKQWAKHEKDLRTAVETFRA